MSDWLTTAAFALIAAAVAPLIWLALYAIADRLGLGRADRMLTPLGWLFAVQSFAGGAVNLLGGGTIAGLGVWAISAADHLWLTLSAALLIPFGLWRSWLGLTILIALIRR